MREVGVLCRFNG